MNHYNHFSLKDRELIKHFLDIGKNHKIQHLQINYFLYFIEYL